MSDQTKLEPCPFCGGECQIVPLKNAYGIQGYRVRCGLGCWVSPQADFDTESDALSAWNRRAPVAADAAAESKSASTERPEGIPNLPSPGWHEAIEEAAKVADDPYTQKAARIRSLLPPGGEGLKK